jgi:hypothetical protein
VVATQRGRPPPKSPSPFGQPNRRATMCAWLSRRTSSSTSDPSRWPAGHRRPRRPAQCTPVALEAEGTTLSMCGAGEAVLRTHRSATPLPATARSPSWSTTCRPWSRSSPGASASRAADRRGHRRQNAFVLLAVAALGPSGALVGRCGALCTHEPGGRGSGRSTFLPRSAGTGAGGTEVRPRYDDSRWPSVKSANGRTRQVAPLPHRLLCRC